MSMGITVVDVCNQALARLGAEKILGLEDGSKGARFCRLFYEQTRDEVLRSHPWNFATKREVLSRLADEPMFGWSRRYQLPGDFVRLVQLNGYGEAEATRNSEIEGNTLLCDEETAQVRYVCRVEDAGAFDPLFAEALAVKLASKIAQPLTGSRSLGAEILQEYERVTAPLARRVDSQEDRPRKKQPWVESAFVRARRGPIPARGTGPKPSQVEACHENSLNETSSLNRIVGGDVGDNDVTLTVGGSSEVVRFITPLTADRMITLSTVGAKNGSKFRITRVNSNTCTVNVDGIKILPASTDSWVDLEYDGLAWIVTGYGAL